MVSACQRRNQPMTQESEQRIGVTSVAFIGHGARAHTPIHNDSNSNHSNGS